MDLSVGQELAVKVRDLAFGGEGVARVGGDFVLFVPFALVGETVEVRITELKKRFGRARLLRILQASSERVTPACPYFGDCGGCQYQHLDYGAQLRLKRKQVADILQRIGGFEQFTVDDVVPCPQPYGYRNRILVRSQWDKYKRGLNIGFIRTDNRLVVDVEECKIAAPELNRQLKTVRAQPPPKGGLKVLLRQAPDGWEVPRHVFFQNNALLWPQLAGIVRERLANSGARFLIDAYCGVGFFSIELSGNVESFVGVEYDRWAVQAARYNAEARGIRNGEYQVGKAEELLPALLKRFPAAGTAIILDPPRKGCPAASLQQLREARLGQVLYVSCHPATLARDLNILCSGGVYELVKLIPLDMFPQTQHIECVGDLRSGFHERCARGIPMNCRPSVAANWRSPQMFAALTKVPLQASSSREQCRRRVSQDSLAK
jgi:tRNA/tmRNA/rRNA uracil-C5-methylase (TrmA/RlmC/RlmD family)